MKKVVSLVLTCVIMLTSFVVVAYADIIYA